MANKKILKSVVLIYIICLVFRLFEYFVLKTDSSIIGEAVVHKIAGIIILIFAARYFNYNSLKIGFSNNLKAVKLFTGVIFGLICFAIAYVIEISIVKASGSYQGLGLYVTSYSISGNLGNQTALIFFLICIIGNIHNMPNMLVIIHRVNKNKIIKCYSDINIIRTPIINKTLNHFGIDTVCSDK